jgi:hypothetical protein
MFRQIITTLLILTGSHVLSPAVQFSLDWSIGNESKPTFKGASQSSTYNYIPVFNNRFDGTVSVQSFTVLQTSKIESTFFTPEQVGYIEEDFIIQTYVGYDKGKAVTTVEILPYRRKNNIIERLEKFQIDVAAAASPNQGLRTTGNITYAANSILSSGDWFKIGVNKTGVYRLEAGFLEQLGINASNANASQFRLYGHKGGMLPELAGEQRTDDLAEIPVKVITGQNGKFEVYAFLEGPEKWVFDNTRQMFKQQLHLYSDQKTYFITTSLGAGKRVSDAAPVTASETKIITSFDDYLHVEEDANNLNKSGRQWLGTEIGFDGQVSYNFNFPNLVTSEPVKVWTGVAARSSSSTSTFEIRSGSTVLRTFSIAPVGTSYIADAGRNNESNFSFISNASSFPIQIVYQRPDFNSKAWPDFVTVNAIRQLRYDNAPLSFRSLSSVGTDAISRFNIDNWNGNAELWDVSDLFDIKRVSVNSGTFKYATSSLKEFVLFETPAASPVAIGKVNNQNLHGLPQADYLIVTRKSMMNYARELGEFHRQKEGYTYHAVDVDEIYNEFSSGNADLSAIRNFVKMFYDRAAANPETAPKFLLLLGSGTFEQKNTGTYLVPSYQSQQSLQTILTYVTDDYFGLLDDNEGTNVINTASNIVDIAIGRILADNDEKAATAIEKIKRYYSSAALGDWRNEITFVADDEDGILHVRDANEVADIVQNGYPDYNVEKIYLDAFRQQSSAGGSRYPDVNEAIANKLFRGTYLFCFVGHGGPNGLGDERIITFDDINRWRNENKLPIFSTATCEFTRFDEPNRFSAGERVLVKKDGGAIALVSTTRLVFAFENRITNENFTRELMLAKNQAGSSLGEVFRKSKAITNTNENNRKFALFGDPALSLAIPQYQAVATKIVVNNNLSDTIKALSKVSVEGEVRDGINLLTDFNGTASLTIFDKMISATTLRNDPSSGSYTFQTRKNAIYKGRAQVVNGKFAVTFIVPKTIDYSFGNGKLSLYAENGEEDATGHTMDIIIGGISDSIPDDKIGPEVDVFLDDESFVFGGTAAPNSTMFVNLFDDSGINTSGAGLGNDITAIIDENSRNPIILNAFYEGEVGDFTRGKVTYPFNELEKGRHTLRIKAWDVLNNSGEGYTEFVVEDNPKLALYYVLNYPNPFTTKTSFSFEHNRPGDNLDVRVEIYTSSGKLVKTLQQYVSSNARRISDLEWDGLDEYGDKIGKGVYIYRITVSDSKGERAVKYQKLVLLR